MYVTIIELTNSPNIYKEARKTTLPYCHTPPLLRQLTTYGNPMLEPVLAFPHGPPYCFRLFHATTRFTFRWFFFLFKLLSEFVASLYDPLQK